MILLGAGGHARELTDIINETQCKRLYFFDDTESTETSIGKYEIIKSIEELSNHPDNSELILGIGDPILRRDIYEKTKGLNSKYINVISDTSVISKTDVSFGWGLNIMHQVFISNHVTIGNGTLINRAAGIHHGVMIGEFCEIGPGVNVLGDVKIGNNVFIGSGATILPRIEVCEGAIIGAGAVVTKNITRPSAYLGVPAKSNKDA